METQKLQEEEQKTIKSNTLNPFSFKGRVRRTTYWITYMICSFIMYVLTESTSSGLDEGGMLLYLLIFIPVYWVFIAVHAKRCHDLGHSGWWMLIPLYEFWLALQDSQSGDNEYGPNPKGE